MRIIKYFEDKEYYFKVYAGKNTTSDIKGETCYWGLGDDGNLYFCTQYEGTGPEDDDWYRFYMFNLYFDLATMIRIVKQFGHLLPFI